MADPFMTSKLELLPIIFGSQLIYFKESMNIQFDCCNTCKNKGNKSKFSIQRITMILVFLLLLLSSYANAGENGDKIKTKNLLSCDNKEDCIDQLQDIGIEV